LYATPAAGGATIVQAVGYAGGSEIPVFNKTYSTAGTGAFTSWSPNPGDCCALLRFSTADRSSKNHPIYCFNYYHASGSVAGAGNQDTLHAQQLSSINFYAGQWNSGMSDGANTYKRSRPNGNTCTGALVEPLITHRDLPR
jgi:hypothetical protein